MRWLACAAAALLLSCSKLSTANGTALFITVAGPADTTVDALLFSARAEDGTALFTPEQRGEGSVTFPQSVRVLLKNGLFGGQRLRVKVDGLVGGKSVLTGGGEVSAVEGAEVTVAVSLVTACEGAEAGCTTCQSSADCGSAKPRCESSIPGGACVACTSKADCAAPTQPFCDLVAGACVGCSAAFPCAGEEICASSGQCLVPDTLPSNDGCENATAMTLTPQPDGSAKASLEGSTSAATNSNLLLDLGPSCSTEAGSTGRDVVFSFELPVARDVAITVQPSLVASPTYQPVLYLRPALGCANPASEISCAPPVPVGAPARLVVCGLAAGRYALFVDGAGTAGRFQLEVKAFGRTALPSDTCNTGPFLRPGEVLCGSTQSLATSIFSNDYRGTDLYSGTCAGGKAWEGNDVAYQIQASDLLAANNYRVTVLPESRFDAALFRAPDGCKPNDCTAVSDATGPGGAEALSISLESLGSSGPGNSGNKPTNLIVDSIGAGISGSFLIQLEPQ